MIKQRIYACCAVLLLWAKTVPKWTSLNKTISNVVKLVTERCRSICRSAMRVGSNRNFIRTSDYIHGRERLSCTSRTAYIINKHSPFINYIKKSKTYILKINKTKGDICGLLGIHLQKINPFFYIYNLVITDYGCRPFFICFTPRDRNCAPLPLKAGPFSEQMLQKWASSFRICLLDRTQLPA